MIRVSDEKENGAGEVQVLQRLVSLAPRDKELRLRLAHKLILFGDYQGTSAAPATGYLRRAAVPARLEHALGASNCNYCSQPSSWPAGRQRTM